MPFIVWVLPEPVWPYMNSVEQPPPSTFASRGCTPRAQTSGVFTVSSKASPMLAKLVCLTNMRLRSGCMQQLCTTTEPAPRTDTTSNSPRSLS